MPASWWREYRRKNRERLNAQLRERRKGRPRSRGDRSAEYAKRRKQVAIEPLPMLRPDLQRGNAIAFWEDELRLDLAQEAELALLEGRCPQEAMTRYRAREKAWFRMTCPYQLGEREDG